MKKTILALILVLAVMLSGTATFAQSSVTVKDSDITKFTDIAGHWAEAAIKKIADKNKAKDKKVKFQPGRPITRSEFAVMLHDALDIEINYFKAPEISDYFTDVKKDAPYANVVIDLVTANILDDEGKIFNPDGKLPREQMVHYIINALKYKLGDVFAYIKIKAPDFKDFDEVTPIYSGDVAYATYFKLITGYGKNVFKPKANATRAEAAKVISNLVEYIEKVNQDKVTIKLEAKIKNDSLVMKIRLTNNTANDIILKYTSGQKFDFKLLDANRKELYVWSADKLFIMAESNETLGAGKTIEYSDTLSSDAFKAIKDKVVYLRAYSTAKSDSFTVNPEGYEIKLK